MGRLREKIARVIAPQMLSPKETDALVASAVKEARQALLPGWINYDPNNEGYRRLTAGGETQARLNDFSSLTQDTMLELAYYLWDTSGLVKRFVRDTKNFVLGEGVTLSVKNDDAKGSAKAVLESFWNDPMNQMDIRLEKRIEFLSLLGEQCWPVAVNSYTGKVWASYVDPVNIDMVFLVEDFPEMPAAVKLKGGYGRSGRTLPVIRPQIKPGRKDSGRMVGECFYFSVNNPPNSPRGRSDLIHLFDFISGFEEGLFDELDRIKGIKSFIWDVTVNGADQKECDEFARKWATPKANSIRVHNQEVTWKAVAPQLNQQDNQQLFNLMKTYVAACMNRPDSWLGSGGKAYQTEADLMGEPTFKDLASRQRFVKYCVEAVLRFVLDQAILAGILREDPKKPFEPSANFPEMTNKDTQKIVTALFSLAQGLVLATQNGWLSDAKAAEMYASVAKQLGIDIDAADEIKKAAAGVDGGADYDKRDALINDIVARIESRKAAPGGAQ